MKKFHVSLQWKFFWCIVLIIIPILGIIFTWSGFQNEKQSNDQEGQEQEADELLPEDAGHDPPEDSALGFEGGTDVVQMPARPEPN